jgi:transcriptional regulator with XRE-family HTH domain
VELAQQRPGVPVPGAGQALQGLGPVAQVFEVGVAGHWTGRHDGLLSFTPDVRVFPRRVGSTAAPGTVEVEQPAGGDGRLAAGLSLYQGASRMPEPTAQRVEHIGTRIRYWRRRRNGMTQAALAGLAGLSQSYISQVESGQRSIDRRSTLVAIAGALHVSVSDLLGDPSDSTEPARVDASASVPAIRVALIEIEEGERRPPAVGPEQMAADVEQAAGLRARAEYGALARLLPDLLTNAASYGGATLAQVGYTASTCLRHLGYRDLARSAAQVALAAAVDLGDLAWIGAVRFASVLAMPIEAAATAGRVTDRAVSELQAGAANPDARQVLGQLHLAASLACATDQRPDDAAAHLQAAEEEARTLGDPEDGLGFNFSSFGPTNIGLWRMTIAAELGEYGRVIELADRVSPAPLRMANRHQAYWLDYGRALARSGRSDAQARAAFLRAEQAAPVPFGVNPMAHDAVLAMVNRARRGAVPKDLRVLAVRLGIDVANGP